MKTFLAFLGVLTVPVWGPILMFYCIALFMLRGFCAGIAASSFWCVRVIDKLMAQVAFKK